jgi:DNA-binding NarL/FixJ family response regulator
MQPPKLHSRVQSLSTSEIELAVSSDTSSDLSSVLSPREREVAFLIARGFGNKEIARELGLSHGTVKQYVHSILQKLRSQKFLKSGISSRYMLIHLMNSSQK